MMDRYNQGYSDIMRMPLMKKNLFIKDYLIEIEEKQKALQSKGK